MESVLDASAALAEPPEPDVEGSDAIAPGRAAAVTGERSLDGGAVITADHATPDAPPEDPDPDLPLVAALSNRLAALLGVASGDEDAFDVQAALMTELYAIALVLPGAQPSPDPVAGVDARGGLTALLRTASGYSRSAPPDAEEVERLAALGVELLTTELGVTPEQLRRTVKMTVPEGDTETPEADPDLLEEDVQDAVRALEADDEDDPDDPAHPDDPEPAPGAPLELPAAAAGSSGFRAYLIRKVIRGDLRRVLKAFRSRTSRDRRPHTSLDGLIAEQVIRDQYMRDHPLSEVLCGDMVFQNALPVAPLAMMALGDASWAEVQLGLIHRRTRRVGQPDILDATLRQVFEIKPAAQALEATAQLYIRYLLPLNAIAYARGDPTLPETRALELARLLLRALDAGTGQLGADGSRPPFRPWLPGGLFFPGPEQVPHMLILPDRREMLVWMPLPGVISYQIMKRRRRRRSTAKVPAASKQKIVDLGATLAALIAAAAIVRGARGAPEPAAALRELAALGEAEEEDIALGRDNQVIQAIVVAVVVGLVLFGLAAVAAPVAAPLVAAFLARGGVLAIQALTGG
jgi:hypothetical protein